jgi:hypothetical protein
MPEKKRRKNIRTYQKRFPAKKLLTPFATEKTLQTLRNGKAYNLLSSTPIV